MDFDEFQESEVMFSDDYYSSDQSVETDDDHHEGVDKRLNGCNNNSNTKMTLKRRKSVNKKMCKKVVSSSLPIHIPNNSSSYTYDDNDEMVMMSHGSFDEDLDEDRMMRLPPHLIVERRRVNKEMARSLPLKERNLYYVRNCIIRMKDYGLS